jgi:AraC family transcriptional regulator of adaptative response / DNA-3-methyladenine glycosylase II
MPDAMAPPRSLPADVCERALDAHDPRFDGLFFVGITTTRIYCRPVCPSRRAYSRNRRFFPSAPAAESAGFRPCLRCRPELAPGRAPVDAMSRLAYAAARRISAGALNGRKVPDLAADLGVSERHLRRALQSEIGVSPLELAQTHRLLLAKRLLTDTGLPVIHVAFASGFQSLRRFNVVFRDRYRMSPTALRNGRQSRRAHRPASAGPTLASPAPEELLRTTLSYRPPLAWDALVGFLGRDALPGIEFVEGPRYGRTVELGGRKGVVFAEAASAGDASGEPPGAQLTIHVSTSLAPVLMLLIARLRQLFDLDAEPTMVDACLEEGGLGALVRARPGLRIPGVLDGFEVAFRALIRGRAQPRTPANGLAKRVVEALAEPIATGVPGLNALMPSAERVAEAGSARLVALGVRRRRADALAALAHRVADGALRLEPGSDPVATRRALMDIDGLGHRVATAIVMRGLSWPDAFPASDRALQRAAGVSGARALSKRAEAWRPWRSYAALHLWRNGEAE